MASIHGEKYYIMYAYNYNILFVKFVYGFVSFQESGIKFQFDDGVEMTFRGTITTFSADNLAAWSVGGFKALASAFRKCQYCMAVDENMQTKVEFYFIVAIIHVHSILLFCLLFFSSQREIFSCERRQCTKLIVRPWEDLTIAIYLPHMGWPPIPN